MFPSRSTLLAAVLTIALAASAASAQTVAITTTNDLAAGNPQEDDLYTASLEAAWTVGMREVRFAEHMFTDRDAGRRFDETWLEVASPLPGFRGWFGTWRAGAVRVGRGLFGESAQNALHGAIGSDTVELDYDAGHTLHPTVGATWSRRILRSGRALSFLRTELASAPGFRHHARVVLDTTWALGRGALLGATAGARGSVSEHDLLAPHAVALAPTWQLRVAWRGWVELAWTGNDLGVGQRHVRLGLRLPIGRGA